MFKRFMFTGALVSAMLAFGGLSWALMGSGPASRSVGPTATAATMSSDDGGTTTTIPDDAATTTTIPDDAATTTTIPDDGPAAAAILAPGSETYPVLDAGSVALSWDDAGLWIDSVDPADGWVGFVDEATPLEVRVEFASGLRTVTFKAEIEGGTLGIRIEDEMEDSAGTAGSEPFTETYSALGAGTVSIGFDGAGLTLLDVVAADGWSFEVDEASGEEIEVEFRMGTTEVRLEAEIEDGEVFVRIGTHENDHDGNDDDGNDDDGNDDDGNDDDGNDDDGNDDDGNDDDGNDDDES